MTVTTMQKINKKIPGILLPPPKKEIDGKITDLSSKSLPQLIELQDRQLKLLKNKPFLSKLADHGAKIQTLYDTLAKEIAARKEEELTCSMLKNLNLDKNTVQEVEWKNNRNDKEQTYLDSDDDSEPEDVLQILSQKTAQQKQLKILQPDKPLITADDLENIGEIPHVKYIVDITEKKTKTLESRQFKPYQTTKSDVHNPEKEILRKKHKHWEVTAATPPPSICGPAKVLSIEESLKLQHDYNIHLKQVEAKHAAEKLNSRMGIKMEVVPNDRSSFRKYREADSDDSEVSDCEASDKEVHDEEPERGGVIFTVMK